LQKIDIIIAGIDEVGRGALAGPVVAAAVVLRKNEWIHGLADSKKLSPRKREAIFPIILAHAHAWGIGAISAEIIDQIGIVAATHRAMRRALQSTHCNAHALVDGNRVPDGIVGEAVIKGDATVPAIAAASVVAKVWRDHHLRQLHIQDSRYGFASHKGYGTMKHYHALRVHGPAPLHRLSFLHSLIA
jgi:ribonuclease HII